MMIKTKVYNWLLLASLVLYGISCTRTSPPPVEVPPPPNPFIEVFLNDYLSELETIRQTNQIPGAALVIVRDTSVIYQSGFGVQDIKRADSVDAATVFRIGSLSKGVVAVLAARLIEEGKLSWDTPVKKYLPDFELSNATQSERVTIGHLLSHTSGLPYHAYTNLVEEGHTLSFIAKQFSQVPLIGEEGEVYAYQNAAFSLVGTVLERVTGKKLSVLLKEELFEPANMHRASATYAAVTEGSNIARPHYASAIGWRPRKINRKYYNAIPAGGINASADDMGKLIQLLLGNRPELLSDQTLEELFYPRVNTHNKRRYFRRWKMVDESWYGYGWRVLKSPQDTFIYHGGYVNGYRSELLLNRKEKLGVCLLTNAPGKLSGWAMPGFLEKYASYQEAIHRWEQEQQDKQQTELVLKEKE